MKKDNAAIAQILQGQLDAIAREWLADAAADTSGAASGTVDAASANDAAELLRAFERAVLADAPFEALGHAAWAPLKDRLASLSRSRAAEGSSAAETSRFVLSFKRPMFVRLQSLSRQDSEGAFAALWSLTRLVDGLAQWTASTWQETREEVIKRQQAELLELSTPVVKLWDGVLAVPMIGTLDSSRSQMVMESLLQRIVETGSALAIVDITGVPTVDTLVAQHLLKTVTAIRLMGAECIISGIRPQIAQTIVHLGIDLEGVTTRATLADALALALKRTGHVVTRAGAAPGAGSGIAVLPTLG